MQDFNICLFAGISGGGVWRRPLSEMITSVERYSTDIPMQSSLGQNYPNPFNPATTISFSVPSRSFVSLKVCDALGKEVAMIVSEELAGDLYSKTWVAAGLASGTYFYRLHALPNPKDAGRQAGSYTEIRKLLLLR